MPFPWYTMIPDSDEACWPCSRASERDSDDSDYPLRDPAWSPWTRSGNLKLNEPGEHGKVAAVRIAGPRGSAVLAQLAWRDAW